MDFIKKNIKIIGIVACVLMLIGNFLPFATAEGNVLGLEDSETINLMAEEAGSLGIFCIVCEVIMLVLILCKKKKVTLIPNIIVLALMIYLYAGLSEASGGNALASVEYSMNIGFYVKILGSIIGIAFAFIKGEDETKEPKAEKKAEV